METFLTTDPIEARACRRAQYAGWVAAFSFGRVAVTGIVHSVKEHALSSPKFWTIRIQVKAMPVAKANRRSYAAR